MGVSSHILSTAVGAYAGVYFAQHYDLPLFPSPTEIEQLVKDYLDKNRKR